MREHLVAAIVILTGCDDARPVACDGTEVCDPTHRCVHPEACKTDDDCEAGLICRGATRTADACDVSSPGTCRPRRDAFVDRFRLIDGFGVPAMRLDLPRETPLTLQWTPPPAAYVVACAVFTCAPEILTADGSGCDPAKAIIHNFDKCVIGFDQLPAVRGSMTLARRYVAADEDAPGACAVGAPRVLDDLLAACWAYDDDRIVAATDLVRLSPDAVGQYVELFGGEPPCDRGDTTFGLLRDGVCQARCRQASDCLPADRAWTCAPVTGSGVGVCAPDLAARVGA